MKKENLTVKTFDYSGLDPDLKGKLICLAGEINRNSRNHIAHALKMGEAINSAHAVLAGGGCEGKFKPWIEAECGISRTSAYRYMHAWQSFGSEAQQLAHFTNEGMYLLSSPDVPALAVKEAKKKAAKGVRVSIDVAKEILNKFREVAATNGKPPKATPPAAADEPSAIVPFTPAPPVEPEPSFEPAEIEAIPPTSVDIPGLSSPYKSAVSEINGILRTFEKLADEERTGVHLADKFTRIKHDLTEAKQAIYQAEPVQPCGKCDGKGCKSCYHSGFWTRAIVGSRKK